MTFNEFKKGKDYRKGDTVPVIPGAFGTFLPFTRSNMLGLVVYNDEECYMLYFRGRVKTILKPRAFANRDLSWFDL